MALRYWLIIIGLGMGWGMSFTFNAVLLRELDPLSITAGRVGLGALGCWIYLVARGVNWRVPAQRAASLMAFGVLSYALPFTCYAVGQQDVASGVAGIINAMTPALTVVVAHLWPGGERATWLKSAGVLTGLVGIVVLSVPMLLDGGASAGWAILITLGAPLCYAFSVNLARSFADVDRVAMVSWALLGAALVQVPLAFLVEGAPQSLSPAAWGALAVIGFGLTSAAFIVFYWVLPRVGPTNITLPTMIAPASALFFGSYLLGEPLSISHGVGLFAILFGLLMIDGRLFRKPATSS
ncbi:EamA family transporter [Epibacterium sp. SM1979]|uniref:EamA family transporter n=1 Tax=Tritonibacter litoralis TaxID=2662264 RepID=A0A843YIS9_9RHOB|nr:DMT family transporter [Tritonibacter litoralis]MQQ08637.1 EamA family transporter [Tritonibacter litoralis]